MSEIELRPVFLKGFKTVLRPLDVETDLDYVTKWINDPEVRVWLKNVIPQTKTAEREWLMKQNSLKNIVLGIETLDGVFIGTMGLHHINLVDRTAGTGAMIGEKSFWGLGYGTDAKMILLEYAFHTLNLRKITSGAYAFNERSIAYSKKCGYQEEGVQKEQVYRNGRYYDKVLLGLFYKDWRMAWDRYQREFVVS